MAAKKKKTVVLSLCIVLFVAASVAFGIFAFKRCFSHPPPYDFSLAAPVSYESYGDYFNALKEHEKQCAKEEFWQYVLSFSFFFDLFESGESWADSGSGGSYGATNIQVEGINEGDVIKNDGKYLYVLSEHPYATLNFYPYFLYDSAVVIVDAYPPGEMRVASKIELVAGGLEETYKKYTDIYISGQNLVVLSEEFDEDHYYAQVTRVDVYDIADKNKPVHRRTFKLEGNLVNSREQNGILYLFTAKYVRKMPEALDIDRDIPYYSDTAHGGRRPVPVAHLYTILPKVTKDNYFRRFTTINIAAVDLSGDTAAEVLSYTDSGNYNPTLYMSAKNIYLMRAEWGDKWGDERYYTGILKLGIDKTNIRHTASKKVPGHMHNQFSADEHKGNLRIATNEWDWENRKYKNHLFVMDENLEIISSVVDMAIDEEIKSVRFDGDIGYIVTFPSAFVTTRVVSEKKVFIDPLFIIDLSDPKSPEIKAELKIPGYSTYMHPLGDGLLLGVGDDTESQYKTDKNGNETDVEIGFWRTGIKASLFDVSDPYNPVEISVLRLGGASSASDINKNHKCFLNIPKYSMFSIRGSFSDSEETFINREKPSTAKNQALVVSYGRDGELKLVQAFESSGDYIDHYWFLRYYDYDRYEKFFATDRVAYIKNVLYHFDGEAVHAYDMDVTGEDGFVKIGSVDYK